MVLNVRFGLTRANLLTPGRGVSGRGGGVIARSAAAALAQCHKAAWFEYQLSTGWPLAVRYVAPTLASCSKSISNEELLSRLRFHRSAKTHRTSHVLPKSTVQLYKFKATILTYSIVSFSFFIVRM